MNTDNLKLDKLIKFGLVGAVGFGINSVLQLTLRSSDMSSLAYILLGNCPGVLWNFFGNAVWTFKRDSRKEKLTPLSTGKLGDTLFRRLKLGRKNEVRRT